MSWFDRVKNEEMMWTVDNDEAFDALEQIAEANPGEKCIVAEGNGHHVIFYEVEEDGEEVLMQASVLPNWEDFNSDPLKASAGEVDNVYQFQDDWQDVYVSNVLPEILEE